MQLDEPMPFYYRQLMNVLPVSLTTPRNRWIVDYRHEINSTIQIAFVYVDVPTNNEPEDNGSIGLYLVNRFASFDKIFVFVNESGELPRPRPRSFESILTYVSTHDVSSKNIKFRFHNTGNDDDIFNFIGCSGMQQRTMHNYVWYDSNVNIGINKFTQFKDRGPYLRSGCSYAYMSFCPVDMFDRQEADEFFMYS